MSETVDIGAARVRLIVDAADFQPVIDQGKNAIRGFGDVAQQAYDRTEKGTRRAADALLDYVNSLGRADTTMDRYIRTASRMGVEKPVLDAAITAWAKHNDEVEQAASAQSDNEAAIRKSQTAYKELIATQVQAEKQLRAIANAEAATRIDNLAQAHAAQSQTDINSLVAPGLSINTDTQAHRMAAEEAFAAIVAEENAALAEQDALTLAIAQARQQSTQANAQFDYNKLLGIPQQQEALALIQRRKDAEAAFLPILEEEIKLEQESAALSSKQQAFVQQLENTATTAGKTYYEMLQLRAAELGIGEAAAPLISKIRLQNEAMGAGTISAKQYEFALRGLPAQFTDIVVSLQGGQRPLTVLLQQGGQIKDMFGGVGNALKVVASEALKIATNPWTLLAGAVAGLGFAAFEAQTRMTELAVATAKGNQIAGSAQNLSTLADQLAKLDHTSIGNADAAVVSLAGAGKLTGKNFDEAAQATARWASITGQGIDEVAGKFNGLATDPMAAVYDGTLRITSAQYAQLVALDRVGDKVGEVALAVKLYQDQINDNSESVLKNLSDGEKGWINLKNAITDAIHELGVWSKNSAGAVFAGFSRFGKGSDDLTQGLVGTIDGVNDGTSGDAPQTTRSGFGGVGMDAATQSAIAQTTKLTIDQTIANRENQKSIDDLGTKQQKFNAQLLLLNGQLARSDDAFLKNAGVIKSVTGALSGPGYDKLVNGLRLKVFGQNEGGDPTKPIKEWEKTSLDAIKNVQQAQTYAYAAGAISTETFYAVSEGLVRADAEIQLQAIDKEKAALKGRANTESQIAALTQQALTVRQTTAAAISKLDHEEVLAVQAKINAYHDYVQQLADANIQLSRQGDQAAGAVGTGSRQNALAVAKQNAIQAEALQERAAQDKVDALGPGDHSAAQVQADNDKAAAAAALSTQLDILQGNYDSLAAAEGSWLNGSKKAWEDWQVSVSNQAAEAGKVFSMVMDGIASDIATAAVTGKLSFKSLIDELLKELVEFGIKQAEAMALKAAVTSGSSGDNGTSYAGFFSSVATLIASANGNAFSAGSGLAAYRNSVVNQPTMFPFAKGGVPNVGLMGEKSGSPGEAIMPLTRTSGGELAVKSTGNAQQKTINTYQTFVVPGAVDKATQSQLAIKTYGAAQRAARRA